MADAEQSLRKKRNRRAGMPNDDPDPRQLSASRDRVRGGPERSGRDDRERDRERDRDRDRERERDRDRDRERARRDGDERSRTRARQDSTANMIKKRYSIRYNQAAEEEPPPVPGMPKIPDKYARGDNREESRPGSRSGPDTKALYDSNLNVDKYIGGFLQTASEQDISDFQRKLKKMTSRAQTDLQQNVYHNRTTFISISKEAEKLKSEMQTLRGLMSDLTSTLGQASSLPNGADPSLEDGNSRKRANRSSLANLEAMYNTQLQTLWRNIEGSQKFLAAMPGRHVVMESGHWAELDGATLKVRRSVHIVLLNDHLLIAARKAKRIDTNDPKARRPHTKLVAVRCWPLNEIEMVVVKAPSRDAEDALAVRHGQESYTFAGDRGDPKDQIELLQTFRRTRDELQRTERTTNGIEQKNKEASDYLATRDPAVSRNAGLLGTLSKAKNQPETLIDVDGKQRNLRWVEGQIDELDIEVALQRFEEAVTHVEQLRKLTKGLKGNVVAQEVISVKIDERATKLAEILTQRLVATHGRLGPTQSSVQHLTRLNCAAQARRAYLSARTDMIAHRARACVFAGDILAHVMDLSYVYFTLIKNTVSVYGKCFPREMGGAVVVWAKAELDRFNEALGRALGGLEKGSDAYQAALQRAKELAAGLGEVGIDFEGLIGEQL